MADKTPIRAVFNDSNVATGLAEFQSGDTIGLTHGGLGTSLSIGTAGQVLKVNSGASALEFGNVEAIVNIDGATDLESQTLVAGDKIMKHLDHRVLNLPYRLIEILLNLQQHYYH